MRVFFVVVCAPSVGRLVGLSCLFLPVLRTVVLHVRVPKPVLLSPEAQLNAKKASGASLSV